MKRLTSCLLAVVMLACAACAGAEHELTFARALENQYKIIQDMATGETVVRTLYGSGKMKTFDAIKPRQAYTELRFLGDDFAETVNLVFKTAEPVEFTAVSFRLGNEEVTLDKFETVISEDASGSVTETLVFRVDGSLKKTAEALITCYEEADHKNLKLTYSPVNFFCGENCYVVNINNGFLEDFWLVTMAALMDGMDLFALPAAEEATEEPVAETADEPTAETMEEPAAETAEEPAAETTEEPSTEPEYPVTEPAAVEEEPPTSFDEFPSWQQLREDTQLAASFAVYLIEKAELEPQTITDAYLLSRHGNEVSALVCYDGETEYILTLAKKSISIKTYAMAGVPASKLIKSESRRYAEMLAVDLSAAQ